MRTNTSRDHALTPEQQKALDRLFAWCDRQDREYQKRRKRGDFAPRLVSHFSGKTADDDQPPAGDREASGPRGGTAVRSARAERPPRRRRHRN